MMEAPKPYTPAHNLELYLLTMKQLSTAKQ